VYARLKKLDHVYTRVWWRNNQFVKEYMFLLISLKSTFVSIMIIFKTNLLIFRKLTGILMFIDF
jgi:hypothetical protein